MRNRIFALMMSAALLMASACAHDANTGGTTVDKNKVAAAAIDCGGQAINSLLVNYLPKVTLALVQPDYETRLTGMVPDLKAQGVADGVSALSCIVKHALGSLPSILGAEPAQCRPMCFNPTTMTPQPPSMPVCSSSDLALPECPLRGTPTLAPEQMLRVNGTRWLLSHGKGVTMNSHEPCGNTQCQLCYPRTLAGVSPSNPPSPPPAQGQKGSQPGTQPRPPIPGPRITC